MFLGDKLFGGSYLSPTTSIWADQQLGLACITHLTNHIRSALSNLCYALQPNVKWKDNRLDGEDDDDDSSADNYYEWKYYYVEGKINERLDEDDEFDDDLMFPADMYGGVLSHIKPGGQGGARVDSPYLIVVLLMGTYMYQTVPFG